MKAIRLKRLICTLLSAAVCTASILSISGCKSESSQVSGATDDAAATRDTAYATFDEAADIEDVLASLGIDAEAAGVTYNINYDDEHKAGFQLDNPEDGDTIAIIHTSEGDITIRFFPEQAPKAVTNFINLANAGAYNGTTFYRVINDFMVQAGNANLTSSYGGEFEDEFCDKLFNIRGAVSMANSGSNTNTSQFFINQRDSETFAENGGWTALEQNWKSAKTQLINYKDSNLFSTFMSQYGQTCYDTDLVPDDVRKLYEKNGGNAHLDGAYNVLSRGNTVFGQVIEGMNVVDKIAAVQTDENDTPKNDITINSIEITAYSKK